jgi:hypothetical protein
MLTPAARRHPDSRSAAVIAGNTSARPRRLHARPLHAEPTAAGPGPNVRRALGPATGSPIPSSPLDGRPNPRLRRRVCLLAGTPAASSSRVSWTDQPSAVASDRPDAACAGIRDNERLRTRCQARSVSTASTRATPLVGAIPLPGERSSASRPASLSERACRRRLPRLPAVPLCAGRRSGRCVGTCVPTSTETPIERVSVTRCDGQGVNRGNGSGSRASPGGRPSASLPRVRGPLDQADRRPPRSLAGDGQGVPLRPISC